MKTHWEQRSFWLLPWIFCMSENLLVYKGFWEKRPGYFYQICNPLRRLRSLPILGKCQTIVVGWWYQTTKGNTWIQPPLRLTLSLTWDLLPSTIRVLPCSAHSVHWKLLLVLIGILSSAMPQIINSVIVTCTRGIKPFSTNYFSAPGHIFCHLSTYLRCDLRHP